MHNVTKTNIRAHAPLLTALTAGLVVLAALPLGSAADPVTDLGTQVDAVVSGVNQATAHVGLPAVGVSVGGVVKGVSSAGQSLSGANGLRLVAPRAAASDPQQVPALHGDNPHGQGSVAVIGLNPSATRPYSADPSGGSQEAIVVGRARGEQQADKTYHGHITIAALFGNEIVGVDSTPGQSNHGPLDAVQTQLLNQICNGSGNQICLTVLAADSSTTPSGSTNHFSTAHATLGGASGVDVGAAESNGNISSDSNCQTSSSDSQVANANVAGSALATVSKSSSSSKACNNAAPQQSNTSQVIGLGGAGVPIPAAGCADGTANTVTGIPTLLPILCNADDSNGSQASLPYGVREALSVLALSTGGTALAKTVTAASESHSVAPAVLAPPAPPAANTGTLGSAGKGNVGGGNGAGRCNTNGDNDCVTGSGPFGPKIGEGGGVDQGRDCSSGTHDGGPMTSCPGAGTAGVKASHSSGTLPFTGADLLEAAIVGLVLLAGGMALRRRVLRLS